jgi:hypothetical protein
MKDRGARDGWSLGGREALRRLKVGPRSTDDGNVGPHQPAGPLRADALPSLRSMGTRHPEEATRGGELGERGPACLTGNEGWVPHSSRTLA